MKRALGGWLAIVFVFVCGSVLPAGASLPVPNALQIQDYSTGSGSTLYYFTNLPMGLRIAATNVNGGGFKLTLKGRFLSTLGESTHTMMMLYGLGAKRFLVAWETNGAGNLVANLEGGQSYTLTTNGLGALSYFTHQLIYNPTNGTASYVVDGQVKTNNWAPAVVAYSSGLITWGAQFSTGAGYMNFNRVTVEVTNTIVADYNAGTADSPPVSLDPTMQGWGLDGGFFSVNSVAVSPDSEVRAGPTTLEPAGVTTSSAVVRGRVRPGSAPTLAWLEWGTNLTYGTTGSVQVLQGLTNTDLILPQSGLVPGVDYHYRVAGSNEYGIVYGADYAFNLNFRPVATGLPNLQDGSAAWADYDRDGLLDVILTGYDSGNRLAQLWRNTGSSFVNIPISGLVGVTGSSVAWADYDNDGLPDFLICGYGNSFPVTDLWRNNGSTFVSVPVFPPNVSEGSVTWADFDNDGRPDFLIHGYDGSNPISQLWRNTGLTNAGLVFTNFPIPGLLPVSSGEAAWADYDRDGNVDFLLTGLTTNNVRVSQLMRNLGGSFTNVPVPGLPGFNASSVAWTDFDNDGRPDFLICGYTGSNYVSQLWRNTGSGFTNVPIPGLRGVTGSGKLISWADYDNDGLTDFLITGNDSAGARVTELWRNLGNGFARANPALLSQVLNSTAAWADYDNDGRIDFLLMGQTTSGELTEVWRNYLPQTNTAPSAPPGLSVIAAGSRAILSWSAAGDSQTPSGGLTYNVRVGTTPGDENIVSPLALSNGFRLTPARGNAEQRLNLSIPVQLGQTYYWSAQAVDGALAGSTFAAEQSFTMNSVLTPPNGIAVSGDVNGNGIVDLNELNGVLGNYNGGVIDQAALDAILERYWPNSPWLLMTNMAGLGGTNVTFSLTNSLAGAFSVEYSTNLIDWNLLGPATPRYQFTDLNAPALPQRYYRLRWP